MPQMKCPVCGGTTLVPYKFADKSLAAQSFMDAFACVRCGRIEFYAREDILKRCISDTVRVMAEDRESSNKSNVLAVQLIDLKQELEHCVERSKDENLTDDEAAELESRILDLYNKISVVERKMASLKGKEAGKVA